MGTVERYTHSLAKKNRKWDQDYLQIIAIDPGKVNFAFRIERRYHDGRIIPIAFWKEAFNSNTFQNISKRLDEYSDDFLDTHIVLIEKQPPRNITINRIMQHAITYFMTKLKDYPLLPEISEINPHVKGNELGANSDENLKKWASRKARELLLERQDNWSLDVMDYWLDKSHPKGQRKDDDLADTVVMIEAYCKKKGYKLTVPYVAPLSRRLIVVKNNKSDNVDIKNNTSVNKPKLRINRIGNSTSTKNNRKIVIKRVNTNNI